MNISDYQHGSTSGGCESGWTSYLNQSSRSRNQCQGFVDEEEEEEDLSMVSDASSGPPHYYEDDECCFDKLTHKSKNKKKSKECGRSQQQLYLDDTASSPVLGKKVTKNEGPMEHVLEFSQGQGFSATHLKGKSALKKHLGFFQSSLVEKSPSKETGGFQGRKWK